MPPRGGFNRDKFKKCNYKILNIDKSMVCNARNSISGIKAQIKNKEKIRRW